MRSNSLAYRSWLLVRLMAWPLPVMTCPVGRPVIAGATRRPYGPAEPPLCPSHPSGPDADSVQNPPCAAVLNRRTAPTIRRCFATVRELPTHSSNALPCCLIRAGCATFAPPQSMTPPYFLLRASRRSRTIIANAAGFGARRAMANVRAIHNAWLVYHSKP
jgi:hypothetical protein